MRHVQLRAFHNVAIHGGFSRAGEALSLTQPAISDQVCKLEEEYDVLLFTRHKKRIALTEFGEKLLDITNGLFEIEGQAQELLSESRALRSGTLNIIADSPHHLLHILAPFRKKYPGIFISLRSGNTNDVTTNLAHYDADIGVLGEVPEGREFDSVKLSSIPIIGFASSDYPLPASMGTRTSERKQLPFREFAELPLVLRERGSKTRRILEDLAAREGITLNAAIEAEGREAVGEIVASGAGVGVVSAAEFGHDNRLVQFAFSGHSMFMDEALICLKQRRNNKMIGAFMAMAAGS